MKYLAIFGLALGLALPAHNAAAQNATHGATEYKLCASCHGFKGEGNELVGAPSLAGLDDWYLQRQIVNFQKLVRGDKDSDPLSQTMATMVRALDSASQVSDVVAYIDTLPTPQPKATLSGDVDKGRALYATCSACHGAAAEGNEALNAPALVSMDDWYQLSQLQAFKNGSRGAHPDDTYGQQMRPMVAMLADDQAMRDVIAYIASLK